MEVPEDFYRLRAQRDDMGLAALHSFCRNAPLGSVQIHFRPACLSSFARTGENERSEFQCSADDRCALVAVQRNKQWPDARRISDSRKVGLDHGRGAVEKEAREFANSWLAIEGDLVMRRIHHSFVARALQREVGARDESPCVENHSTCVPLRVGRLCRSARMTLPRRWSEF